MRKYQLWFLALLGLLALARTEAHAAPQLQKLVVQPVNESARTMLKGNTLSLARAQNDQGEVADSTAMSRMLMVLKRSSAQQAALKARLEAQANPASPYYHKWLTPAEYGATYGPAASDVAAVTSWLNAHGFSSVKVSAGQNVIEFSGTAAQVQSAFQTSLHTYKVNGQSFTANASDPTIPTALAGVIGGLVSLNNYQTVAQHTTPRRYNFNKQTGAWSEVATTTADSSASKIKPQFTTTSGSTTVHLVSPWDFATLYNVTPLWNAGIDGSGQTIAVVSRSNIDTADVDNFRASFGLPASKLKVIVNGDDPGKAANSDESEAALDVQWAGAVAKNATIDLIVSKTTSTTDGVYLSMLYAIENNVAPILSVSYGTCEYALGSSGNLFMEEIWQQAVAQGTTVTVASGDAGSAACDQNAETASYGEQVNGMASTPYNLAIGGTDFNDWGGPNGVTSSNYWSATNDSTTQASVLSYVPEMVWNSSCAGYMVVNYLGDSSSEAACNDDTASLADLIDTVAGGGGTSHCTTVDGTSCSGGYARPSWQAVAGVSTSSTRDLPDLSLFSGNGLTGSDLVYCQSDTSPDGTCNFNSSTDIAYLGSGGTSFATPAFAGIMALVNQKMGSAQGNAAYALYTLARGQYGTAAAPNTSTLSACNADQGKAVSSSCIFYDVNTGTNTVPCQSGSSDCVMNTSSDTYGVLSGYSAGTGFDLATGLGSVNAYNLVTQWSTVASTTATTTSFTLSPTSSTFGDPLSFTATVRSADANATATPTGTMILVADKENNGSYALSGGSVSATINDLDAGTYSVYASYLGDDTYQRSSSTPITVTIAQAASSSTLTISDQDPYTGASTSNGTVHYGFNAVATATVKGATSVAVPTGTVQFTKNGTASSAVLNAGTTHISSTGDAVGSTLSYTASYQGDTDFSASTAAAQTVTVIKGDTYVRLTPSTSYLVGNGNVTVGVEVYTHGTGSAPTGNLALAINGSTYDIQAGTAGTDALTGGSALSASFTLPASALSSGGNTLSAVYGGDSNYNGSQNSYVLGASAATPVSAVTLTATPASGSAASVVTLSAQVSANGVAATAGSVHFFDGGTEIGLVPVQRSGAGVGTATLRLRPDVGTHSYTATFSGTGILPTANSTAASVSIDAGGALQTKSTLTASANTTNSINTDFVATVTGQGYLAPSGAVAIQETSVPAALGSLTLDTTSATPSIRSISTVTPDGNAIVEFAQTGDVNGDGYTDLVLRVGSAPSQIWVYLNKGDGSFATPNIYTVGNASRGHGVAVGDINGDGYADIVTVNQTDYTVSILLGNGDGTFLPAYTLSTGTMYPGTVGIADLNHDGIPDLYVAATAIGGGTFLGKGDGTFAAMQSMGISVWSDVFALTDLNGDGFPDLVHTSALDPVIRVQMGNGDGTFATETDYTITTTAFEPQGVQVGDVNNDGKLDLVFAGYFSSSIEVLLGNGDGTFQKKSVTSQDTTVNPWYRSIALVDLDHDGKLDLLAADPADELNIVLRGNGDGTFTSVNQTYTLPYPSQVIAADLDGDGMPDAIETSQSHGDVQAALLLTGTTTRGTLSNVTTQGAISSTETATGTYAGDTNFAGSTSAAASFTGSGIKTTPTIVWTPVSSNWGVNELLGTDVLDATTQNNVAGSFSYTAQLNGGTVYTISGTTALPVSGTYTLTANFLPTNTADYTTASRSITLTVLAADYAVAAPTDTLQLTHNGTATGTITVSSANGFTGAVNLSCSTAAAGIGCAFSPTTLLGAGTTTLTLSAPMTKATTTALNQTGSNGPGRLPLAMAGLLFSLLLLPKIRRSRALLPLLLVALVLFNEGCSDTLVVPSTLTVSSNSQSVAKGSAVTLTATVTANTTNKAGSVTFYDGTTALGTAVVSSSGTATLSSSGLAVGIHSITARYTGAAHAQAAASATYQQLVTGATTVTINAASGSLSRTATLNLNLN